MGKGVQMRVRALGVVTAVALAGGALAQEFQRPPDLTLEDRPVPLEAFRVPRDRLATQDSHPFLLLGRVMDETHPRWSEFRSAIRSYPDVDPCLEEEQRGTAEPDLLAFDWNSIRREAAMEVCLFRVFQSLREPELIEAWVLRKGFRTWGFDSDPRARPYMRRIFGCLVDSGTVRIAGIGRPTPAAGAGIPVDHICLFSDCLYWR